MFFYELDRFSEDLDFDSPYPISLKSLKKTLEKFGEVSVKKDTPTVKRLTVKPYGKEFSIKFEVSLRNYSPVEEPLKLEKELKVYGINDLFLQKLSAFVNRRKARDLYDLGFIVSRYGDYLLPEVKEKFLSSFKDKMEIYDLIPHFFDEFQADRLLTDSDLLRSVERLMGFYERERGSSLK